MDNQWAIDVVINLRKLGLSQKEFAKLCGYSEQYMSQMLRGKKSTDPAKANVARVLRKLIDRNRKQNG